MYLSIRVILAHSLFPVILQLIPACDRCNFECLLPGPWIKRLMLSQTSIPCWFSQRTLCLSKSRGRVQDLDCNHYYTTICLWLSLNKTFSIPILWYFGKYRRPLQSRQCKWNSVITCKSAQVEKSAPLDENDETWIAGPTNPAALLSVVAHPFVVATFKDVQPRKCNSIVT